MKLRSIRMAIFAFALAGASLCFAGDQPGKMHMLTKTQMQDRSGMTRAVQFGKGTGMTRNQVLRGNAYRSETAADSRQLVPLNDNSGLGQYRQGDTAFRK